MNDIKHLKVQMKDNTIKDCIIMLSDGPPWKLFFSGVELGVQEFVCEDIFESLRALREELEKIDAKALCAGARPEVFPSGMAREMSGGRKAYITRLGFPSLRTDLVDIFDYADPGKVGSVAQQNAFHKQWIDSLLRQNPRCG
jgi:hypothetical protein